MEKKLLVSLIIFILICIAIWLQINFINIFTFFGVSANLAIVIIVRNWFDMWKNTRNISWWSIWIFVRFIVW